MLFVANVLHVLNAYHGHKFKFTTLSKQLVSLAEFYLCPLKMLTNELCGLCYRFVFL